MQKGRTSLICDVFTVRNGLLVYWLTAEPPMALTQVSSKIFWLGVGKGLKGALRAPANMANSSEWLI